MEMFPYSSSETVIPTLTFTKAELVYAIAKLLQGVPDTDNSTRIEMVELRHYLNQIKDRVLLALEDGTIGRAMVHSHQESKEDAINQEKRPEPPSMAVLKGQFPNLSEDEIKEVLEKAKSEQMKMSEGKREQAPPPPPSFIANNIQEEIQKPVVPLPLSPKEKKDRENSRKFAQMLSSL